MNYKMEGYWRPLAIIVVLGVIAWFSFFIVADLSTYFLLVLSAIYLEKYLVTITGYAAFKVLVPLACVICAAGVILRSHLIKHDRSCTGDDRRLFSELLSKVSDTVTVATDKIENVLNHYLEALAVLLVTSCVIPMLVLLFFVWLVKIILGVSIPIPRRDQWEGLRHP